MAKSNGNMSEEARIVIKNIRSLVISRSDASTVRSITRDYLELIGEQPPYAKFGFASFEEMLKASGEFLCKREDGQTRFVARMNSDSTHMRALTKSQNSTKPTSKRFIPMRQPEPRLQSVVARVGGNSGTPTAYSRIYSEQNMGRNRGSAGSPQKMSFRNTASNNNGCAPLTKSELMLRAITKTAQGRGGSSPVKRGSPEANNNSQTKNYNLRGGGGHSQQPVLPANDLRHGLNERTNLRAGGGHSQQVLPVNDLRHGLNARNTGLSRSSVDMRQTATKPAPAPAPPSSTAAKQQSSSNDGQAKVAVVNRPTNSRNVIAGSGRVIPPSVAPLPLMPINVPRTADSTGPAAAAAHSVGARSTTSKSVNSRIQQAQGLVSAAPAAATTGSSVSAGNAYQRAQSLDERCSSNGGGPVAATQGMITTQKTPSKLQDRLAQAAELVPPAAVDKPCSFAASSQNGTTVVAGEFDWNDQTDATPVERLVQYSASKGYDRPEYRYFRVGNNRIQCGVTVNGIAYATYPADFANEFEGQFAAALKAIEGIKADESRHTYEVCLESDLEVANRLYDVLTNRPFGMISKRIPEAFLQTHQLLLPDHWFSIIHRYLNQLFVLEDGVGDTIVYACEQPSISDAASNTSEARQMAVNELQLPWAKQYWDLYITNPVSTVEVWARLVGVDYSDKMDALITDIEMAMMSDQPKADESEAAVGEYYLVSVTDCWYRVRVDEINYESNQCQCFFIDIGEKEQIPLDQLYQCDPKYLELPGQAKRFTLEGLEDFCENPKAKPHLDALISGRVFIGEILTKREKYEDVEQASGIGSGQLKVALYDTSSDHDVLLNPVILKHICDDTPEPELNRKDVNAVTISYIDDQGDVYCQLVGTMEYLQKLITNLTQSNALDGKYRGLYKTKAGDQQQQQQLYLVQDETDGKWYRAELEAEESGPSCRMRYVDVGCRRRTNVSNIYRLEMLSLALSRYPPQAIRMRMFGLDLTEPLLARLRALLKPAMRALAKVCVMAKVSPAASASLPLVRVFVYVTPQAGSENIPVCVNDAIAFEKELELCSELISAPRISDSVLSNGSSSSTSNTTSSSQQSTAGGAAGSLSSTDTKDLALRFGDLKLEISKGSSSSGSCATSPTKAVAKLPQMTLPAVGQLFDVKVVIASSPNYFIVQPYANAQQLNRLMHELQDFCTKKAQPVRKEHVQQNEVYAALNTDGHWYRVSVVNILSGGPTPIHAFFCDFGRIGVLDVSALRALPANFRVLPQQAIKAKLHGVKPLHKDWQADDAVRFQRLTVERKFASIVRGVQADEINRDEKLVELELIDVSSEEDIYLHKTLVDEGRAVYTTAAQTV